MTVKEIRTHIENIVDLSRSKTLKEANAIKHIGINDEKNIVILLIEIGRKGTEAETILKRELAKAIKIDLGFNGVKIQFEESKEANNIAGIGTKFIIISSAKGGSGKSTLAINLAYALKNKGKKVGLLDADIYTSNIPLMLYMEDASPNVDTMNKIIPFNKDGIQIISTYFFSQKDSPLLWKGSMLETMVNNFLFQVSWDKELDYLIIDTPAGTGEVNMALASLLPKAKVLIVSESNMLSSVSTLKSINACNEQNQEILGIVINKKQSDYAELYFKSKTNLQILANLENDLEENTYVFKEGSNNYKAMDDLATLVILND